MTQLEQNFAKFDAENPHVWVMFCNFARQMADRGHAILSSKLIFERMRWETMMTTNDSLYKLNNNYTAYYARKWNMEYPTGARFMLRSREHDSLLDLS